MSAFMEMNWRSDLSTTDESEALETLLYDPRFTVVEPERVVDTDRWHHYNECVVYDTALDCHWQVSWVSGATEYQDCDLDLTVTQVEPYEVLSTRFRAVLAE